MPGEHHSNRIEFALEDEGSITARDRETGLARGGDTRSEALAQLAEVLALEEDRGEPITEADLREWGLNPEDFDDSTLPEFLR